MIEKGKPISVEKLLHPWVRLECRTKSDAPTVGMNGLNVKEATKKETSILLDAQIATRETGLNLLNSKKESGKP